MQKLLMALMLMVPLLAPVAVAQSDAERAVASVLDDFHDAASKADGTRYFGLFAENGVFLGTDATERWTVEAFQAYAKPYFDQGRGWTYTPTSRHIYIAPDGQTAWFDEMLMNANFGECRGTGVLVREGDAWKVAQYHLTVPVPNALLREVVGMIRGENH